MYISSKQLETLHSNQASSLRQLSLGLSLPLWNLDKSQLSEIIKSEFTNISVAAIDVSDGRNHYIWMRQTNGKLVEIKTIPSSLNLLMLQAPVMYSAYKVGNIKLYYSTAQSEQDLSRARWFILSVILSMNLVLVIGLYILFKLWVLRPIQLLESYARSISITKTQSDILTGLTFQGELGSLKRSILAMVEDLAKKNVELINSSERFKKLVENLPIPIAVFNDNQELLYLNATFARTFGYSINDIPNVNEWFIRAYPDSIYREEVIKKWSSYVQSAIDKVRSSSNTLSEIIPSNLYQVTTSSGDTKYIEIGGLYMADLGIAVLIDVTERIQYESELSVYRQHLEDVVLERTKQLEESRVLAEAANRAKSTFLSNMSHELRTPLNSVMGYAQLLKRDVSLTEPQTRSLDVIHRSANHLLNLINSVLELSKIEAGVTTLVQESANIKELASEVIDMMRVRAEESGLSIDLDSDDLLQPVLVDAFKLKQVLLNLLSNAVKFTSVGGVKLTVKIEAINEFNINASFFVKDSGHGIPANEIIRIFDPFVQLESSEKHAGTGLGLTISKKFIELMGGELRVESIKGKGSMFSFDLNLPLVLNQLSSSSNALSDSSYINSAHGKLILIVDYSDDTRSMLVELLRPLGAKIFEAKSGNEAKELVSLYAPDFIFIDWRMKDGDGISTIEWIRSMKKMKQPVIIIMTANNFIERKAQAIQSGADELLSKPILEQDIYKVLTKYISVNPENNSTGRGWKSFCQQADANFIDENQALKIISQVPAVDIDKLKKVSLQLDAVLIKTEIERLSIKYPDLAGYLGHLNKSLQHKKLWDILGLNRTH